ncbi:MAG: nucleoid occlusion factor SlmA [Methylotenera sp.]|uniref:nucleoid occlusion factor SlmA n=1 Tax=Methylotenera sp. TaxID=2051956 RepID=UPI0024899B0A|nr:nucleoid occlusion factor SlmA [Methylotenera sp.]MDI1309792.1 nucleoid occlusion factor SlmA [Methylotenera sp.]
MAGERKQQILEMLAKMLEAPKREKITTASLAAKLEVSEAALYRHFANKAQMFEGLITFIEETIFGLINKIGTEETDGLRQIQRTITMLLAFADKNPGMTRVLIGDALVNEDEKLQVRINQLYDRIEVTLKQSLRIAETQTGNKGDAEAQANLIVCYILGRWQQFAKSGFKRKPTEYVQQQISTLINF